GIVAFDTTGQDHRAWATVPACGGSGLKPYRRPPPRPARESVTAPTPVAYGDRRAHLGEARSGGVESSPPYLPDGRTPGSGSIVAWYETVLAFPVQHVLDEEWRMPESLS